MWQQLYQLITKKAHYYSPLTDISGELNVPADEILKRLEIDKDLEEEITRGRLSSSGAYAMQLARSNPDWMNRLAKISSIQDYEEALEAIFDGHNRSLQAPSTLSPPKSASHTG